MRISLTLLDIDQLKILLLQKDEQIKSLQNKLNNQEWKNDMICRDNTSLRAEIPLLEDRLRRRIREGTMRSSLNPIDSILLPIIPKLPISPSRKKPIFILFTSITLGSFIAYGIARAFDSFDNFDIRRLHEDDDE